MKLTLIVGKRVVTQLAELAKSSRRRVAAVAYVGDGASRLQPFRKGDTLVVDMSEESVRRGNSYTTISSAGNRVIASHPFLVTLTVSVMAIQASP